MKQLASSKGSFRYDPLSRVHLDPETFVFYDAISGDVVRTKSEWNKLPVYERMCGSTPENPLCAPV